jgi:hypothetical protein
MLQELQIGGTSGMAATAELNYMEIDASVPRFRSS